jgi:hypothetical protein
MMDVDVGYFLMVKNDGHLMGDALERGSQASHLRGET